ncbi:hypothetical protein Pcinc_034231 [Petrolisthes cinctipes]|uniref:Uncharacterized protein n=1 Tax=Petrolisthes cinctipes TaxID=88211 RepID=A0AAE1EQN3_PETCI|nr:hypothetical protein Pcinc_034231 [Petrolisthes cinctipes]
MSGIGGKNGGKYSLAVPSSHQYAVYINPGSPQLNNNNDNLEKREARHNNPHDNQHFNINTKILLQPRPEPQPIIVSPASVVAEEARESENQIASRSPLPFPASHLTAPFRLVEFYPELQPGFGHEELIKRGEPDSYTYLAQQQQQHRKDDDDAKQQQQQQQYHVRRDRSRENNNNNNNSNLSFASTTPSERDGNGGRVEYNSSPLFPATSTSTSTSPSHTSTSSRSNYATPSPLVTPHPEGVIPTPLATPTSFVATTASYPIPQKFNNLKKLLTKPKKIMKVR